MTSLRVAPLEGVDGSPWSAASAPVRALVSGYSSRIRGCKLLVVLQAYIDDSQSHLADRRLFLAGYINTADRWTTFSEAWERELKKPPAIAYFKMSEANYLTGEFSGWLSSERDKKIQNLGKIICASGPTSIHASVSCEDVKNIIAPVAPYGLSSPYFYCFQAIMVPIAVSQSKSDPLIRVPIDFIFDEQGGLGDETRRLYKMIRKGQSKEVRDLLSLEPVFRDDKLVMPLQAADILAWHLRRNHEYGDPTKFMVPDFLSHDGRHMAIDLTPVELQKFANGFANIPDAKDLISKVTWKKNMKELDRLLAAGFIPPRGTRWKNALYSIRERLARLIGF